MPDPTPTDETAEAGTIATEEAPPATVLPEPEPELEVEAGSSDKVVLSSRLDEAIALLRRPPAPEAVRFKIQTNPKDAQGSALIVTYIDSRFCSDRLNIVAPGLWSDSYAATPHGTEGMAAVLCRVKLTIPLEEGGRELEIIRSDVGTSSGLNDDKGMKGLYSDAFKRACVKLGIGACIYAAPKQYLNASELGGTLEKPRLTGPNETKLRAAYARWLALDDVQGVFGVPLSHGDAAGGSQGDVEAEHDDTSAPPPGFPLGEPASEKLVGQLGGALQFLLDDLELAGEVHGKVLERCGGYMPAAVAACIGIAAGAVKKRDEELAAVEAHAELDAAAAAAAAEDPAGQLPEPEPATEPEAEAAPAADEPAAAPAAEATTEGSTPA